jgi:TonB-linked SusC/RagA family outer membrane protein
VYGSHSNGVNFLSYFGNLQYAFNNKYSASLVIRRDGSSRFGKNQRWGTFPAVSIGWNLSEESWFQDIRPIDYLRVRLGYGEMGNSNNVHPDNQFNRFTTSQRASHYDIQGTNNQARQGYYRNIIGNPFGTWETAVTKNLGLDVLLWEGRFDLSLDIWTENTQDLLFQYPITVQTGFEAIRPYVNVGEVRNQGVDLQLGTKGGIGNGLSYEIMVNGSFLKNKLISLGEGIDQIPGYSTVYALGVNKEMIPVLNMIGHPISSFYGYRVLGLFSDQEQVSQAPVQQDAAPGRFQYQDLNTTIPYKPTIDPGDRTILGNPIADFTGGIVARIFYRNFELALYGYTSVGNEIFNLKKSSTDFFNSSGNAISERIINSWTFENPQGGIPLFEDASNFSTNTQSNSYYVEDGSYFRMQNISLGYNVSPKLCTRWGLTNMKITVALNNLFTITSYDGLDPMVGGNLDYNFGIDRGNYPLNTSWTLGVNVDF